MKNTQSKIRRIKTAKELGTMYCLGYKYFTHNCRPQEVKMTNKVLRGKSNYVACRSSESRFLKQNQNNNNNKKHFNTLLIKVVKVRAKVK